MFIRSKYMTVAEFDALDCYKDQFPVLTTEHGFHWRWYIKSAEGNSSDKAFWIRVFFSDNTNINIADDPVSPEIVEAFLKCNYNPSRTYLENGKFGRNFDWSQEFEIPISNPVDTSEEAWKNWAETPA